MSWLLCIKFPISRSAKNSEREEVSSDCIKASVVLFGLHGKREVFDWHRTHLLIEIDPKIWCSMKGSRIGLLVHWLLCACDVQICWFSVLSVPWECLPVWWNSFYLLFLTLTYSRSYIIVKILLGWGCSGHKMLAPNQTLVGLSYHCWVTQLAS